MSRIGKLPIALPAGTEVRIEGSTISVKGPKGALSRGIASGVQVVRTGSELRVEKLDAASEDRQVRANYGLMRALINNMVVGVTKGFERKLEIQGVGFKSEVKGKSLILSLGFSHQVEFPFPDGISVEVEKGTKLTVKGCDKQVVGETATQLKKLRAPDSYKGKGVRFEGEHIRLKPGKTAKK